MAEKVCPRCNNKRHIFQEGKGWIRCICVSYMRATKLMSKSGFPRALWEIEPKEFNPNHEEYLQELSQALTESAKTYDKQNMFIYSEFIEKDKAAAILCRSTAILHEEVKSISYTTIDQLVQRGFGKEYEGQSEVDPEDADITVVAIGAEMTNAAHRSRLYQFLYNRLLSNKQTVVVSWIPDTKLMQVYQKAITTLLTKYYKFYVC